MAKLFRHDVIEQCQVSPPQNSSGLLASYHLPLTFLDIPWLFFSPSQPLFFYEFPYPTSHFTSITLPNLKHSLSLTLQHFYSFAGTLLARPEPAKPELVYSQGDSVSFTVVVSYTDFGYFCGNYQRNAEEFHALVPKLASTGAPTHNCAAKIPLLSVQVTLFPNCGICIGIAYHHVVADQRTFNNFIKTWASFSRHSSFLTKSIMPSYDRNAIVDQYALEGIFLKEWWKRVSSQGAIIGNTVTGKLDPTSMVRATFIMDLTRMERVKNWIISLCNKANESLPVHLSAYVLTCALVWISLIKSQEKYFNLKCCGQDLNYFGFIAGGLTRLNHPVPSTYVGNCVGFGRAAAMRSELLGDNGIVVAAKAIGNTVKKLDKAIFEGAEKWISDCKVMFESELHDVMVSGSPKVDLYETDFGLGRPKKIEDIGIDGTKAISLTDSRDASGGMEVGLVLNKLQMEYFTTFFMEGLSATP